MRDTSPSSKRFRRPSKRSNHWVQGMLGASATRGATDVTDELRNFGVLVNDCAPSNDPLIDSSPPASHAHRIAQLSPSSQSHERSRLQSKAGKAIDIVASALFSFTRLRLHARTSFSSQVSARGESKKKTASCDKARTRKTKPSHRSITQACCSNLETNTKRAREEPRRAPDVTGPGLQREWLYWDVDVGNALSAACQYTRGNAREERARRLRKPLLAMLAPQREAFVEDLNPSRRCGRAKLNVNCLQDTTLFCDNLLDRPS